MLSEASSRLWEPIRSYPAFCSVSRLISHPGIVGGLILFYSTKNKQGTVCRTRATPCFLGLLSLWAAACLQIPLGCVGFGRLISGLAHSSLLFQ